MGYDVRLGELPRLGGPDGLVSGLLLSGLIIFLLSRLLFLESSLIEEVSIMVLTSLFFLSSHLIFLLLFLLLVSFSTSKALLRLLAVLPGLLLCSIASSSVAIDLEWKGRSHTTASRGIIFLTIQVGIALLEQTPDLTTQFVAGNDDTERTQSVAGLQTTFEVSGWAWQSHPPPLLPVPMVADREVLPRPAPAMGCVGPFEHV